MRKLILTFAILVCALVGYSQDKGTTQLSALHVSSTDVALNVSSPAVTHYFLNNVGLTVGIANFEDINVGAKYYVKDNNFAYTNYGTNSESLDLGVGRTFSLKDHIQIEPRFNFTDIIEDDRNLGLSVHLNFVF